MSHLITWSQIQSGATFQALVNCLVFFEDSKARLFTRPGKDGGQDALSGDGKTVYQAKYHQLPSSSQQAIRDALSELEKIREYKQKSHSNYHLWKDVEKWILVTNVAFNPNDDSKWNEEVVPEFAQIGLDASVYWTEAHLTVLLSRYPDIHRTFFEGQNRIFLSLPEEYEILKKEFGRGMEVDYLGHDDEKGAFKEFLRGTQKIMCMHGPGGIGKTRSLYEFGRIAADEGILVYWANTATMEKSADWYHGIVPERNSLLLLDEPSDPHLIKIIAEQINTRAKGWKLLVATRSSNDSVLDVFRSKDIRHLRVENDIVLKALEEKDAHRLIKNLFSLGPFKNVDDEQIKEAARKINSFCSGYPIWIGVAVKTVEEENTFPSWIHVSDIATLAQKYCYMALDHVFTEFNKEKVFTLVRWIALLRIINAENKQVMSFLEAETGFSGDDLERVLHMLVKRNFIQSHGINQRLHAIKPDVIRDYLVKEWLTMRIGHDEGKRKASKAAEKIVKRIVDGEIPQDILGEVIESFAAHEHYSRGANIEIKFLDPLIAVFEALAKNGDTRAKRFILDHIKNFSFSRAGDASKLITLLRTEKNESNGYRDMVAKIPSVLFFDVARYATASEDKKRILREMCLFVSIEKLHDGGLFTSEKPSSFLSRIIIGGPELWSDYTSEAVALAREWIAKLNSETDLASEELHIISALLPPLLAIERRYMEPMEDDGKITSVKMHINLRGPLGELRSELRNLIRGVVENRASAYENRKLAWRILAEHNTHMIMPPADNQNDLEGDSRHLDLYNDCNGDLSWTLSVLQSYKPELWEMALARKMWEWHIYHDKKDHANKRLAQQCEAIYQSDSIVQEFYPLQNDLNNWRKANGNNTIKGEELAECRESSILYDFIERMKQYPPRDYEEHATWNSIIPWKLAQHADDNPAISQYAFQALADKDRVHFKFGKDICMYWSGKYRSEKRFNDARALITRLLALTGSSDERITLLHSMLTFSDADFYDDGDFELLSAECKMLIEHEKFVELARILGRFYLVDWTRFTSFAHEIFLKVPSDNKSVFFDELVETMELSWPQTLSKHMSLSSEKLDWVLDLMFELPDLNDIRHGLAFWVITEQLKQLGLRPLSWLVHALEKRTLLKQEGCLDHIRLPFFGFITTLVEHVNEQSAANSDVLTAMERLLDFNKAGDEYEYDLPENLVMIDPDGYLLPDLVSKKIAGIDETNSESITLWSRFAGYMEDNSEAWRKVAIAACEKAKSLDERMRKRVFYSLQSNSRSSSYPYGTMDPFFKNQLDSAQRLLQEETDSRLFELRAWRLKYTEAEYKEAKERFEERGE